MLSLGGIPPTVGFLGKYVVFLNAVGDGLIGLAVLGVLASLIGVFYYLRVVYVLYMKPEERQPEGLLLDVWGRAAAVIAALGTLALGIWPYGAGAVASRDDHHEVDGPAEEVSPLTLNRLSFYLRCLRQLQELGIKRVSSQELAQRYHLSATQIRKDLAQFGEFGIRGVGYEVDELAVHLTPCSAWTASTAMVIVGMGNLGTRARAVSRASTTAPSGWWRGSTRTRTRWAARSPASRSATPRSWRTWSARPAPRSASWRFPPRPRRRTTKRSPTPASKRSLNFAPVRVKRRPDVLLKNVDLRINLEELAFFLKDE